MDGKIVEISEKTEEESEEAIEQEIEMSELVELFTKGFEHLTKELNSIKDEYSTLKSQFSKFSGEPAGERLYFQKDLMENIKKTKADRLAMLSELRKKQNK